MTDDRKLDTAILLETPEGAAIELRPAGLFTRGVAFLIDEIMRWSIVTLVSIAGVMLGRFGTGLVLVATFLTYWLYGVFFEVFNGGITPGKRSQGLIVVHDDGTPIRLPSSIIRNLVLSIDILPMAYVVGIVSMLLTSKFQRLGDLAGGTMVVYHEQRAADAGAEATLPMVEGSGARAPLPLSVQEQGYFVDYLERAESLSPERAAELAMILEGVLAPASSGTARREVELVAQGLKGS